MILALQTAGPVTQMWLFEHDEIPDIEIPTVTWQSDRRLADELLAQIESLLGDQDMQWSDLSGLIIFSGPGSFTSLRIGHTVLNTLADSLNIPIVGCGGEDWITGGIAGLKTAVVGQSAVPVYGGEANITRPKA